MELNKASFHVLCVLIINQDGGEAVDEILQD